MSDRVTVPVSNSGDDGMEKRTDPFSPIPINTNPVRKPISDSRYPYGGNRESGNYGAVRLTAVKDLLNEPTDDCAFVVDRLLPVGGLSILAAKPKVGKTTLACQLAADVARKLPFL